MYLGGYGWKDNHNHLEPYWYQGNSVPESLTATSANNGERMEATSTDDEQSDNAWSEDSDDNHGGNCEDAANVFISYKHLLLQRSLLQGVYYELKIM